MNAFVSLSVSFLAQAAPPAAPAPEGIRIDSVWDFVVKGGPVMIPIGLVSLIALAVVIERLVTLRRRKVIPPSFLAGVQSALKDGRDDRRHALEYCRSNPSPIASIFAAGIKSLGEPIELLEKHIQEAGEREVVKLRKYLRVLSLIASISPLLGLLGTIMGLIEAFQTVAASGEALGKTELLAGGIYEAMITTAAGLIVAIPVIISYHWIAAKIEALVSEMDRVTLEFVEQYARPGAAALPPAASAKPDDAPSVPVGAAIAGA